MTLNLGVFALEANELHEAEIHLKDALTQSRALSFRICELSALDSLGSLLERTGALDEAQAAFTESLSLALEVGSAQGEVEARLNLGRLHLRAGRLEAAEAELQQAERLAVQAELPKEQITAAEALMELCEQRGDLGGAINHARTLRQLERQRFDTERERQTRQLAIQFEVERAQQDARLYQMRTGVEQDARQAAERQVRERTAELARAQHEVVTRLAMAAEYRDDTTGEHTRRVGRAAARIAHALGWPEAQASVLGVAARLHDVGKIGIPDSILLKTGRLDPAEFAQMQSHTLIGARILSGGRSALLQMAEEIARSHHERWDGNGYPLGLRGTDIPLTGRIVAVADVFDALIQARPYKAAWSVPEALEELQKQSGQHFDPDIVAVAVQALTQQDGDTTFLDLQDGEPATPLAEEDASHILAVFEQLLVERTRELELARQEAERTAERMARMALTDNLTGLNNRWAFEHDLESRVGQVPLTPFTVLSLDVDGLKRVNDGRGHEAGDQLLVAAARALEQAFAGTGVAYRIGGDEFAVICERRLPADDRAQLETRANALLAEAGYAEHPLSLGAADHPGDARSAGDLLRLSDQRMYQNKLERRNRG